MHFDTPPFPTLHLYLSPGYLSGFGLYSYILVGFISEVGEDWGMYYTL